MNSVGFWVQVIISIPSSGVLFKYSQYTHRVPPTMSSKYLFNFIKMCIFECSAYKIQHDMSYTVEYTCFFAQNSFPILQSHMATDVTSEVVELTGAPAASKSCPAHTFSRVSSRLSIQNLSHQFVTKKHVFDCAVPQ